MGVVRRLDGPGEERILRGIDRADGRGLEMCTPSVTESERAVRRGALLADLRAEGSVGQVELLSKLLEERRVMCLDLVDRATRYIVSP